MPTYEVEVRVTARYFVERDEEVAGSVNEAWLHVDALEPSEIMDSVNVEVDEIVVLDANEV